MLPMTLRAPRRRAELRLAEIYQAHVAENVSVALLAGRILNVNEQLCVTHTAAFAGGVLAGRDSMGRNDVLMRGNQRTGGPEGVVG